MKHASLFTALLVVCWLVAGCHPSPPSLVGTYSAEDRGKRVDFLRVEQKEGKFMASESQRGDGWKKPQEVKPLDKADLQRMLQGSSTDDVVALGTNQAALCKVPKGWKAGQFESKTGYVFLSLFGPVELHKDGE